MSNRALLAVLVAVGAVFPLLPGVPVFWVTLLNNVGLGALVAIGLVVLTGVGGLTSFGQAAFCGFGAFTTAVLTTRYGWSPWATLPVAVAITGGAALVLGLLTMRLSGHYLPLGTIAWGLSLYFLFGELELFHRHDGITAIPPFNFAGYDLYDSRGIYYVIWAFVILASVATHNLLDSRTGRAIRALRGGGIAAESFGVEHLPRQADRVRLRGGARRHIRLALRAHAARREPDAVRHQRRHRIPADGGARRRGPRGRRDPGRGPRHAAGGPAAAHPAATVRQPRQLRDHRVRCAAGAPAADRARGAVAAPGCAVPRTWPAAAPARGRAAAGPRHAAAGRTAAVAAVGAQGVRRPGRRQRRQLRRAPARDRRPDRPQRCRQEHHLQSGDGRPVADVGRDQIPGRACFRARLAVRRAPRHRAHLSARQRPAQHERAGERRARRASARQQGHLFERGAPRSGRGGAPAQRGRAPDRAHGACLAHAPARRQPFAGPAPHRRDRARAVPRSGPAAARRAGRGPPPHGEARAGADADAAQGGRAHHPAGRARHELRHGPHRSPGRGRFRHQDRRGRRPPTCAPIRS